MSESLISIVDPADLVEDMTFDSSSRYRLIRRLGEGGMGEVWLANRTSAGGHSQLVAIKFIRNTESGRALVEEALRISRLSHDNIVPFVDSGRDCGGRFFVAMTYVDGIDLNEFRHLVGITSERAYAREVSVRIPEILTGFVMFMVLRALDYAHSFNFGDGIIGLVHRDVSPGNILINESIGFVKLTDFGVAIASSEMSQPETSQSGIAGTIPYMAPEILNGEKVDARADIYALGLVAYELLTGFNPNIHHKAMGSVLGSITEVMLSLDRPIRPPHEVIKGIDLEMSQIVVKMLSSDPCERFPSAEAVVSELNPYLYSRGVGPSTSSVAAYLEFMRRTDVEPNLSIRRALSFLMEPDGRLNIAPRWELTPQAVKDLDAGRNPGRCSE